MTLNTTAHKNILIKILKDIYTDNSFGHLLGFKGGTAVYLFYNLDRFSVDLDFDLLDENKEEGVLNKIESIAKKYGTIKEKANKKNTLFILLSHFEEAQNIKIEINKRNFGSQYEVKNYLGISMLVMRREDMFAHKLVAMTERAKIANRDIFDVHFFLKNNWEITKEIVEQRTEMTFSNYLKKCIDFVDKLSERGILSGLGELIDEKQKTWIKSKLKQDTLFLLKLMLENELSIGEFSIKNSVDLICTKTPGGILPLKSQFAKERIIEEIEQESDSKLRIKMSSPQGEIPIAYIRAKNENSIKKIELIYRRRNNFLKQEYQKFISNKICP